MLFLVNLLCPEFAFAVAAVAVAVLSLCLIVLLEWTKELVTNTEHLE